MDTFEKNENSRLYSEEEAALDELIRSTREELARNDAMMEERHTAPTVEKKKRPRRVKKPAEKKPQPAAQQTFQPRLPREYAELAVGEEKKPAGKRSRWQKLSPGTRTFIYVAGVLAISLVLALTAWVLMDDVCALTGKDQTVAITVEEGDRVGDITAKLKKADLIEYKWLFRLYCGLARADDKIVPGTYELNDLFDYHALVNGMASYGRRATATVMIPEGYNCREMFALLEKEGVCTAEELWDACANEVFDYEFLADAPEQGNPNRLEGCLFPDTYEFYLNDEPRNVLNKLLQNTDKKLTEELWAALEDLNAMLRAKKASGGFSQEEIAAGELSMYDVLVVASLIEKEAANAQESGTIASVIYNRLCSKNYPYLNIDATIQYALEEHKEVLSNADLEIDSPYNTYKYRGLPAGAISNPGVTSIRGALFPKETDYYFYALGNDGVHHFTRNNDEHLAFLGTLG